MKSYKHVRSIPVVAALAVATLVAIAGTAFAAGAEDDIVAGWRGPQQRMARLDTNGDGAIDRSEAAAVPRLAERFDKLDRNGDGRIDASERPARRGHHRGRGGRGGHGGMQRIVALDSNQDGRISKAEAADMPRLAEHFDDIDGNRDGYIVRSELRAHHERKRAERTAKAAERREARFKEIDSNGDARLSRAEVEAGMPRMAKAFAFMDENRDGYLSREELHPKR